MNKVYIINGGVAYTLLFKNLLNMEVVGELESADLVCFTGGEDVSPFLYGDYQHDQTWNSPERDAYEGRIYSYCREHGIPMVGICRGGQFLNVMSGGRMYQHVTGHTQSHYLVDKETGHEVYVSSTHHQMMLPGKNGIIIAESYDVDSHRQWYDGHVPQDDFSDEGIEVVFYPDTKCLCFQPHPEFASYGHDAVKYRPMAEYFQGLVESRLLNMCDV